MYRKISLLIFSLLLIIGFSVSGHAATVPAPDREGEGFKAVNLEDSNYSNRPQCFCLAQD